MPITTVVSDAPSLTLMIVAGYWVPVERVWDAYADANVALPHAAACH